MVHINKDMLADWLVRRAAAINRADVVTALDLIHKAAKFLGAVQAWQYSIHICQDKRGIIHAIQLDGVTHPVPRRREVA